MDYTLCRIYRDPGAQITPLGGSEASFSVL